MAHELTWKERYVSSKRSAGVGALCARLHRPTRAQKGLIELQNGRGLWYVFSRIITHHIKQEAISISRFLLKRSTQRRRGPRRLEFRCQTGSSSSSSSASRAAEEPRSIKKVGHLHESGAILRCPVGKQWLSIGKSSDSQKKQKMRPCRVQAQASWSQREVRTKKPEQLTTTSDFGSSEARMFPRIK